MAFDTIFAFEADFAGALQCIPMAVRYKLDLCGIKLSLRQWSFFAPTERHDLVLQPCEDSGEIAQYRATLKSLVTRAEGELKFLPIEAAPAWTATAIIPAQIIAHTTTLGIDPPSIPEWRSLTTLQRFTLWKLSRDSHDNVNFIPAMQEFGLMPG